MLRSPARCHHGQVPRAYQCIPRAASTGVQRRECQVNQARVQASSIFFPLVTDIAEAASHQRRAAGCRSDDRGPLQQVRPGLVGGVRGILPQAAAAPHAVGGEGAQGEGEQRGLQHERRVHQRGRKQEQLVVQHKVRNKKKYLTSESIIVRLSARNPQPTSEAEGAGGRAAVVAAAPAASSAVRPAAAAGSAPPAIAAPAAAAPNGAATPRRGRRWRRPPRRR